MHQKPYLTKHKKTQNTARSERSVSKWLDAKVQLSLSHSVKVREEANRKLVVS